MTLRRAVVYVGGSSLLIAWFASAASVSLQRHPRQQPQQSENGAAATDGLAAGLEAQGRRLKERLAAAPLPQRPVRNPFAFRAAEPPAAREMAMRRAEPVVMPIAPAAPIEPVLLLIGVAEQRTAEGVVRTAVFSTDRDEPIFATVGDDVLGRYKVTALDAAAAELTEAATGRTRRLVLQDQ